MTAMELNAELFRQLSLIADDETLMRKAVKAIQRITKKKEEAEYISRLSSLLELIQGCAKSDNQKVVLFNQKLPGSF